jgi:competence protein ComEC
VTTDGGTAAHHEPPDRSAVDLRLALPALAVWPSALVLTAAPVVASGLFGVAAALALAVLLVRRPASGRDRSARPRFGSPLLVCGTVLLLSLSCAARIAARDAGRIAELTRSGSTVELVGTVRSSSALASGAPGTWQVLLAVEAMRPVGSSAAWSPSGAAVRLFVPDGPDPGTRVVLTARLSPSTSGRDRAVAIGRVRGEISTRDRPDPLTSVLASRRHALTSLAADLPGDAGALLPGVAVGDTSALGSLDAAMKTSGLAHLTAVSGAHFSMIGAVVLALSSWCGVPRRWRWLPVSAVGGCFVLLVGPGPTVVRAALMGGIGVLGIAVGRPSRSVPALLAAVLVLLIADPWLCADLGFLLSVVATGGIATLAAPLAGRWTSGRVPSALAVALAVPVAAQAACAPVILLIDPAVSLYAVPANLVAAPAVAPATVGGLLAALCAGWWPFGAELCAAVAGTGCWWIGAVARCCAALPGARVSWLAGWPGLLTLAVATGAGLALLLRCRRSMAP